MSPAEIEELKFGAVVPPHLQALLPRLLEERERLLAGIGRLLTAAGKLDDHRRASVCDAICDARLAVEFAEAPSVTAPAGQTGAAACGAFVGVLESGTRLLCNRFTWHDGEHTYTSQGMLRCDHPSWSGTVTLAPAGKEEK